jgi:hypothetical protein
MPMMMATITCTYRTLWIGFFTMFPGNYKLLAEVRPAASVDARTLFSDARENLWDAHAESRRVSDSRFVDGFRDVGMREGSSACLLEFYGRLMGRAAYIARAMPALIFA